MTEFIEFKELLNYEVFVPLLILIIQVLKNPVDMLVNKVFNTTFHTMYLVFIVCFVLRLLILALDGALVNGRMVMVTFANSVFISTSGIGMYEVLKKGKEIAASRQNY